jgi:cyclase
VGPSASIPSGYEVVVKGGRERTGIDAVEWARRAESLGAGEICLNSIDADGTRYGYELMITAAMSAAVGIPVIASGGAGRPEDIARVLTAGRADAALIAGMVHDGSHTIRGIKDHLARAGIPVRSRW